MQGKLFIGSAAVLALLGAIAVLVLRDGGGHAEPPVAAKMQVPTTAGSTAAPPVHSAEAHAPASVAPNYQRILNDSTDYHALVESLRPLAERGDAAAQYWMFAALVYCSIHDYQYRDLRTGEPVTPEEALRRWPDKIKDADNVRLVHRRCAKLYAVKERFAGISEWLEKSARSRYPPAQVYLAVEMAAGAGYDESDQGPQARNNAIQLARDSLRTGDPEVLLVAGGVAYHLNGDPSEENAAGRRADAVWIIAACQRGAACGQDVEWIGVECKADPQCQPFETAVDLLRRKYPQDFPAMELRAREINEQIDAGRFDEIEFR